MKEKTSILIIAVFLLLVGFTIFYFSLYISSFNFYKAEIAIEGNRVTEKIYFEPDKPYHTLYRNFESPIFFEEHNTTNYIQVDNVTCSDGSPYVKNFYGVEKFFQDRLSSVYIKDNEYGCTFGEITGFAKGNEYWIEASYIVHPKNIFKINGKNYIKFVAYSPKKHKLLKEGKNLFVSGGITQKLSLPSNYLIIYIPYEGDINFNIVEKNNFEFDNAYSRIYLSLVLAITPSLILFLGWFFFSRERSFKELPSSLSYYPKNRKPWEVASFFNPPFSSVDKNFFASVFLDLKRRGVIETKMKDREVYVKISDFEKDVDEVERGFITFIKKISEKAKPEDRDGDFFNLTKTLKRWNMRYEVSRIYRKTELAKKIKEESKKYLEFKSKLFIIPLLFVYVFISYIIQNLPFLAFGIATILIFRFNSAVSSLFWRFKESYYSEYQEWQAFKNYLKSFPSMRNSPPEAVRLWDIYLIYASALGVSRQVLNKFKDWKIIQEKDYVAYNSIILTSSSISSISGASRSGGGFGGAAGGGVGGGGGGGR